MKLEGNTLSYRRRFRHWSRTRRIVQKLGNKVIISGRRRVNLDAVVGANPGMTAVELDITDPASIDRVTTRLIADYPDLNVLFNNAAITLPDGASGIDDN